MFRVCRQACLPEKIPDAEVQKAVSDTISALSEKKVQFTWSEILAGTVNRLPSAKGLFEQARGGIDAAIEGQRLIPLDREKGIFTSAIHLLNELSVHQLARTAVREQTVLAFPERSKARDMPASDAVSVLAQDKSPVPTERAVKLAHDYVEGTGAGTSAARTVLAAVGPRGLNKQALNALAQSGSDIRIYTPLAPEQAARKVESVSAVRLASDQVRQSTGEANLDTAIRASRDRLMSDAEQAVNLAIPRAQQGQVHLSELILLGEAVKSASRWLKSGLKSPGRWTVAR